MHIWLYELHTKRRAIDLFKYIIQYQMVNDDAQHLPQLKFKNTYYRRSNKVSHSTHPPSQTVRPRHRPHTLCTCHRSAIAHTSSQPQWATTFKSILHMPPWRFVAAAHPCRVSRLQLAANVMLNKIQPRYFGVCVCVSELVNSSEIFQFVDVMCGTWRSGPSLHTTQSNWAWTMGNRAACG